MIGISKKNFCASLARRHDAALKSLLIFPAEYFLIVFNKAIYVVRRGVGRVEKYEIALRRFRKGFFEVATFEPRVAQKIARTFEIVISHDDLGLCPNWDVELTCQILSVQPIITSSVQVQELCSSRVNGPSAPIALCIVERRRM
jgi:hypothetical protein